MASSWRQRKRGIKDHSDGHKGVEDETGSLWTGWQLWRHLVIDHGVEGNMAFIRLTLMVTRGCLGEGQDDWGAGDKDPPNRPAFTAVRA